MGPGRVLRVGLCSDLSGKPVVQEGRLQTLRRPGHPEPRGQRQHDLLAADVRRLTEVAVSAAQRLPRAEGHPRLRRTQRNVYDREQVIFSHRSAGNNPQEVDHREPGDDSCL